jgi:hypothetical protein
MPFNKFRLEQHFSNPFDPKTVVCYTLGDKAQVKLRVLNLLQEGVFSWETNNRSEVCIL